MAFIRPTLKYIGSDGLLEERKLQQCVESSFAEAAAGSGAAADAQWPFLPIFRPKIMSYPSKCLKIYDLVLKWVSIMVYK